MKLIFRYEINGNIKNIELDVDAEILKNNRFTGKDAPLSMTETLLWQYIKDVPKYFTEGDKFMHKDKDGNEVMCIIKKVYFLPSLDSWVYDYIEYGQSDDSIGVLLNVTVETLKLKKIENI